MIVEMMVTPELLGKLLHLPKEIKLECVVGTGTSPVLRFKVAEEPNIAGGETQKVHARRMVEESWLRQNLNLGYEIVSVGE